MALSLPVPGAWHSVWEWGDSQFLAFTLNLTLDRQWRSNGFSDIFDDRIIESVQSPRSRLHCPCLIGEEFKARLLTAIPRSAEGPELWFLSGPSSVCSLHSASSP